MPKKAMGGGLSRPSKALLPAIPGTAKGNGREIFHERSCVRRTFICKGKRKRKELISNRPKCKYATAEMLPRRPSFDSTTTTYFKP